MASFVFILLGCGRSDAPPATPLANQAPGVPQTSYVNTCAAPTLAATQICPGSCSPAYFPMACGYRGGSMRYAVAGRDLCMTTRTLTLMRQSVLNPDAPCGSPSADTGMVLRPNDRLTIESSGSWGQPYTEGRTGDLWGLIHYSTSSVNYDCDQVSSTGIASNTQLTHAGKPAGLLASDGTEAFELGDGISEKVMNRDGVLKIGFNIAPSYVSQACGSWTATITRTHCEDAAGTSYPCPAQ